MTLNPPSPYYVSFPLPWRIVATSDGVGLTTIYSEKEDLQDVFASFSNNSASFSTAVPESGNATIQEQSEDTLSSALEILQLGTGSNSEEPGRYERGDDTGPSTPYLNVIQNSNLTTTTPPGSNVYRSPWRFRESKDNEERQGSTALHSVAASGHADLVTFLLGQHADPNQTDSQGRTPLHMAAKNGHSEIATLLLIDGLLRV